MLAYQNFVFVLGSEDCENGLFIVISYYRNGIFINEVWIDSVTVCKQEYLAKYRDLIIQETSLDAHIRVIINRFVRTVTRQREIS